MCNLHFKISFIPHQKKAYHISVSISPGTHPSGDRFQEISLEMCKSGLSGSDQNLCWQLFRFNVTGYLILSINSQIHPFLYLFELPRNTKTTNELTKEVSEEPNGSWRWKSWNHNDMAIIIECCLGKPYEYTIIILRNSSILLRETYHMYHFNFSLGRTNYVLSFCQRLKLPVYIWFI